MTRRRRLDRDLRGLAREAATERSSHAIAAYNEEDCVSTLELRDWLLGLREEAESEFDGREESSWITWFEPRTGAQREAPETGGDRGAVRAAPRGAPRRSGRADAEADRPRWLLAQLLDYHRREAKPVWWAFFDRMEAAAEVLQERSRLRSACFSHDRRGTAEIREAVACLTVSRFRRRSTKMRPGLRCRRPGERWQSAGTIVAPRRRAGMARAKTRVQAPASDPFPRR